MALTPSELEAEAGTVLPERDTLSFLHFGGNHSFVFARNTSLAVNGGFFSLGNVKNLGDYGGFDEEASSLIFLGLADLKMTLYSDEDFDKGGVDEETKQFAVDTVFPPELPLVGFKIVPNFNGINYDTDSGESIND